MNKIYTTIEQSKKLIELGVDVNTADMFFTYDFTINNINGINGISNNFKPEENDIPAWSLAALLEIMPNVEIESKVQNFNNKSWCISSYDDEDHNHIWVYNDDELVDACVELIYKLKEQNYDTKRRKRTCS